MAKLTAVYGPMFAGKTTWLLERVAQLEQDGQRCLVFKPRLDNRYGGEAKLHAHSGMSGEAMVVDEHNPGEMLEAWVAQNEQHKVIVIDEAMFFDKSIVEIIKEMLARELSVIVAGLDTNFRREPFGAMPMLIKLADEQCLLKAKCYRCGSEAIYSARTSGGVGDIVVGASESYQPACENCHTILEDSGATKYPDLRPQSPRLPSLIRIEVMADSMRVGKTTAVRVIGEGMRKRGMTVTESYEDWQHNPYLQQSYADPAKNFLESQKWFVKRKWEQIGDGVHEKGIFIQDVSPEMDYCYAETNRRLARMSEEHFAQYDAYFRGLDWRAAPKPDLLVYLQASDRVLLARAETSRREFESVDDDYFLTMKRVNREWLEEISNHKLSNSQMNILIVDTDKLDFAHDEGAKRRLVEKVSEKIGLV